MQVRLGTAGAGFAEVVGLRLAGERGLVTRLVCALDLRVAARRVDEQDSDRLLVAASLVALDADLYVNLDGARRLLGACRCLDPLPLRQGERAADRALRLGLDLGADVVSALARGLGPDGLALALVLRGQLELWENPLYDADGYQRMRVGDSGLSRALQAMGQVELAALAPATVEALIPREAWVGALGA